MCKSANIRRVAAGLATSTIAIGMILSLAACGRSETGSTAVTLEERNDALYDQLPQKIKSEGRILVGGAFDNPPMISADPTRPTTPVGIAPDLGKTLGSILGVDIVWQNTQWGGQLPGLDSGSLDAIWGQISVREDREKAIVDMIPTFRTQLGLVVPKGNPRGLTGLENACGTTIGLPIGSTWVSIVNSASTDFCVSQGKPPIKAAEFPGASAGATALLSGGADAVIDTTSTTSGIAKANEASMDQIDIPVSQTEEYDRGLVGIAVSKENPSLSNAIAAALQQMHDDGSYQNIVTEYAESTSVLGRDELVVNLLSGTPAGEKR